MKRRHHRPSRQELLARMPRAFRPRLDAAQRRKLELYSLENLDAIATGDADFGLLWDWVESVLTWLRVAQLLGMGEIEMAGQLDVAARLVERYGRTGRVGCDGPDYQRAKIGLQVMTTLAAEVDVPTATAAVLWSAMELRLMQEAAARHQPCEA